LAPPHVELVAALQLLPLWEPGSWRQQWLLPFRWHGNFFPGGGSTSPVSAARRFLMGLKLMARCGGAMLHGEDEMRPKKKKKKILPSMRRWFDHKV